MTTLKDRPLLKDKQKRVELIRREPPRRRVRWIAWTISIVVIGLGALVAVLILGGEAESFEATYEAESALSYGARHDADFTIGFRWVGESDMTLEEFEATVESFETTYEAESALSYGARHDADFTIGFHWVGESDMTLEEFEATTPTG